MFLELADCLNSTAIAIDLATNELVEASTYQAYGGADSDYRPESRKSFREDCLSPVSRLRFLLPVARLLAPVPAITSCPV